MALKAITTIMIAVLGRALALRPENVTICDYYTPLAIGKDNSPASQQELMLKITHTFILGNYTTPIVGVPVHGIAAPGKSQEHDVNLLPYFVGGYASTNEGGSHGVAQNFLDDGGAGALAMSKPANGTRSKQYDLLTHVYQYFGTFYGCSHQGGPDFPSYQGKASMFEVHKYMAINTYEMSFFITQIVDAVASFGFEDADIKFTNDTLYATFGHRCSPPTAVIPPDAGEKLQSICVASNCTLDDNASCGSYPDGGRVETPVVANATLVGDIVKENDTEAAPTDCKKEGEGECASASGSASGSASATGNATSAPSDNGAPATSSSPPEMVWANLAWTVVMVGGGVVLGIGL